MYDRFSCPVRVASVVLDGVVLDRVAVNDSMSHGGGGLKESAQRLGHSHEHTRPTTCGPDRYRRRWLGLGGLLVATFMGILDVFIVNVAAPSIQTELRASFGDLQMVLAGYVLAYAVGLVSGGRLGDTYGRKRLFLAGVVGFTVASVGCAVAPNPGVLILIRVVQGFAAAVMLPQVLSIVQVAFPVGERPRALGFYGATIGLGSIAGQLVGGALIAADVGGLGWRTVFLVNVPMGVLAVALVMPAVRESRADETPRLDLAGAGLLAVALMLLLYPLVEGPAMGWPGWTFATLGASIPVFAGFIVWERRLADRGGMPLLAPRLFRQRGFAVGLPVALVFYSGNAGLFLLLAYFLQDGLHLSALISGVVFLPLGVGFAAASLASRPLVASYGVRVLAVGAIIMAAGLLTAHWVTFPQSSTTQAWLLAPALLVVGVGQGLVAAPLIGEVLVGVAGGDAGAASGALLTATQAANALGVAVVGSVFTLLLGSRPGAGQANIEAFRGAFTGTLMVLLALAAATFVLITQLQRGARSSTSAARGEAG